MIFNQFFYAYIIFLGDTRKAQFIEGKLEQNISSNKVIYMPNYNSE